MATKQECANEKAIRQAAERLRAAADKIIRENPARGRKPIS